VYFTKIHYPSDFNLLLFQCLTGLRGSYYFISLSDMAIS